MERKGRIGRRRERKWERGQGVIISIKGQVRLSQVKAIPMVVMRPPNFFPC